mmetsp:Transcript_29527/g.44925  ORF Transcript_29527/g.44925 Transcript_29527/m.44925 type:complete len:89 (-) Transcript_29527:1725-1991(-)
MMSDTKIQDSHNDIKADLLQGQQSAKMVGALTGLEQKSRFFSSKSVTPAEMLKKIVNNLDSSNVHKLSKLMDNKKYFHKFNSKVEAEN